MIKLQRWAILFIVLLLLLLVSAGLYIRHIKSQRNVAIAQVQSVQKESKAFQDDAGLWRNIATAEQYETRTLKQLVKANNENTHRIMETFNIKIKQLETSQRIALQNITRLSTGLRDTITQTIVNNDTVYVPVKIFDWKDKWTTVNGFVRNDSIDLEILSSDSLEAVVYWDRKWFLGRKHYKGEIVSKNPNTKIVHQEVLIKKDRRRFLGLF